MLKSWQLQAVVVAVIHSITLALVVVQVVS
jgi:ABC-type thiamin/hydroxymethylpyrimidine transport system permease subunit